MRGTLFRKVKEDDEVRITPAHAGNTVTIDMTQRSVKDHPRPCGEHLK